MQPCVLLDAGGTLIFPDHQAIRDIIARHGFAVGEEPLRRYMTEFVREYDELLRSDGDRAQMPGFLGWVMHRAGVPQRCIPSIVDAVRAHDAEWGLWTCTYPWVITALDRLLQCGYRMSVISNADGRVAQHLEQAGLAAHFERVFDSHLVGFAKPDPQLFVHAMDVLGVRREQCLYVGDLYFVDVLGANRAGIAAIHLDPYNLYEGWPGCHLKDVSALPDFLAASELDLESELFFPLRHKCD